MCVGVRGLVGACVHACVRACARAKQCKYTSYRNLNNKKSCHLVSFFGKLVTPLFLCGMLLMKFLACSTRMEATQWLHNVRPTSDIKHALTKHCIKMLHEVALIAYSTFSNISSFHENSIGPVLCIPYYCIPWHPLSIISFISGISDDTVSFDEISVLFKYLSPKVAFLCPRHNNEAVISYQYSTLGSTYRRRL